MIGLPLEVWVFVSVCVCEQECTCACRHLNWEKREKTKDYDNKVQCSQGPCDIESQLSFNKCRVGSETCVSACAPKNSSANTIFESISLISLFPLQRCHNTNKVRSIAKGLWALSAAIRVKLIPFSQVSQAEEVIVLPLNQAKMADFDFCCGVEGPSHVVTYSL